MIVRRLAAPIALLLLAVTALPAQAAVTMSFWSRDFGNYFPHAFFQLRGALDAGGAPVDASYGFTARSVTPAILFGNVAGRIERPKLSYMQGSRARFEVTLSDAQYGGVLALVREWDAETGDPTYNLGKRNCVTFVREAARRAGLSVVDFPRLMKKPTSFLRTVAAANATQVRLIEQDGKTYLGAHPPLGGEVPVEAPVSTPGTLPGKKQVDEGSLPRTEASDPSLTHTPQSGAPPVAAIPPAPAP